MARRTNPRYADGWHQDGAIQYEVKDGFIMSAYNVITKKVVSPLRFGKYEIDYMEGRVKAKTFFENKSGLYYWSDENA